MSERGIIFELSDGRIGVMLPSRQPKVNKSGKMILLLYDNNHKPIISKTTKQQAVVFRKPSEVKQIGFVD